MIKKLLHFIGNLLLIFVSFYLSLFLSSFLVYKLLFGLDCPTYQCGEREICAPTFFCQPSRTFGLTDGEMMIVFIFFLVIFTLLIAVILRILFEFLFKKIKENR